MHRKTKVGVYKKTFNTKGFDVNFETLYKKGVGDKSVVSLF